MWFEDEGQIIETPSGTSHVLDIGKGPVAVLLHGSGPGVSAGVNWYRTIGPLSRDFRVIAPDFRGFGKTPPPADGQYSMDRWAAQVLEILDALDIPTAHLIGNSLGARVSMNLASAAPDRIGRVVLMGGPSPMYRKNEELNTVYSYEPDREQMGRILRELFAYDPAIVEQAMVDRRYEYSIRPGAAAVYATITKTIEDDLQSGLLTPEIVRAISSPTLIVHGRDDRVVPVACAEELIGLIDGAESHLFSRCGHWAQIEHAARFNTLVTDFLRAGTD
ncbi:MAG: alpha/beta fold hydrolase [Actinomycetia bacterium]|jgi:2-hydroxymuconate-semialdehyde hydrolase|nr:alpha/beta fold hydrolase [Actinomycetes bacterium]